MKEYLEKQEDGGYKLVYHKTDIEVPEGADAYTAGQGFYKNNGSEFFIDGKKWIKNDYGYQSAVLWQRSETEYLMQGKNGEHLMESVGQLKDNVNQPSHYTSGGIECLEAMQAMLSRDEFIGFLRGNVFKYNWRYKLKNGIEDLKKAQFYQNKLIELESDDAI